MPMVGLYMLSKVSYMNLVMIDVLPTACSPRNTSLNFLSGTLNESLISEAISAEVFEAFSKKTSKLWSLGLALASPDNAKVHHLGRNPGLSAAEVLPYSPNHTYTDQGPEQQQDQSSSYCADVKTEEAAINKGTN